MPGFRITLTTKGGREIRQVARRLADAEPTLRRHLQAEIRREGRPTLAKLRRAARAIPADGPKSRGTRDLMARNTEMADRVGGVRFRVQPLPGDRRNLPPLFEGLRRWRHPVYGREVWVTQAPHPWFYPTVEGAEPAFQRACERAIDETLDELGG